MIKWGIDVGVGSLGFVVLECDENGTVTALIDGVAHRFPASIGASERRQHKSERTQNQRRSKRLRKLAAKLLDILSLPDTVSDNDLSKIRIPDSENLNTKELVTTSRIPARALGQAVELSPENLFFAIMHIARNRGQRLTRAIEGESNDEKKDRETVANQANSTLQELADLGKQLKLKDDEGGVRRATPAHLLYERFKAGENTRLVKGRSDQPLFTRAQVRDELERLLENQSQFHKGIREMSVRERFVDELFRECDPPSPMVGRCRYGIKGADGKVESRIPVFTDCFQKKRIYEETNNIRLRDRNTASVRPLTLAERDKVASTLLSGVNVSAAKLRTLLGLGKGSLAPLTSLEEAAGKKGRKTAYILEAHPLAKAFRTAKILDLWEGLSPAEREGIFTILRENDDQDNVLEALQKCLPIAEDVALSISGTIMVRRRGAAGPTATRKLLNAMQDAVISNTEAETMAGLTAADADDGEILDRLPYYGEILLNDCIGGTANDKDRDEMRYGKIPNPVVHVALNRIRKLANRYLERYGNPDFINIELARDLNKSAEERSKIERIGKKNQKQRAELAAVIWQNGGRINPKNLLRMKLFTWQDQKCLYTGKNLEVKNLFDGSTEIDHILPRSDTLDDGIGNLALVLSTANQDKAKRTPYDAFAAGYAGQDYATILNRVEKTRRPCLWRFQEDALEQFRNRDEFQSRFMNDTRYIGKAATRYLTKAVGERQKIVVLNGVMTSELRRIWGLGDLIREMMIEDNRISESMRDNHKHHAEYDRIMTEIQDAKQQRDALVAFENKRNAEIRKLRYDHRHHLLDAIVVGCVVRSDVQRLQTLAARISDFAGNKKENKLQAIREWLETNHKNFLRLGISWRGDFREWVKAFLSQDPDQNHPDRISRVTIKSDHNAAGAVHKETNYGIICEVTGTPGQYIARTHRKLNEITKKETIEAIGVDQNLIDAVRSSVENGQSAVWGGEDPVSAILNLNNELLLLRDDLLQRYEAARQSGPNNKSEKDAVTEAIADYIKATGRYRYTKVETKTLRILGNVKEGERPKRAVATESNDHLIHWLDGDGNPRWQIVKTIDAATPQFVPDWRCEGGRLIFKIRKDDIVEMTNPNIQDANRRLYRFATLSDSDWRFVPLEEARDTQAGQSDGLKFTVRIRSESKLNDAMIVHVLVTEDGRVRWRSAMRNPETK